MKRLYRIAFLILSLVMLCVGIVGYITMAESKNGVIDEGVSFHYIDVNSITVDTGDSCLIVDHDVVTLIDCGKEKDGIGEHVISYLKGLGITQIDNLIISHPHNDHIGSLPKVVDAFDVKRAYYTSPLDWEKVRGNEVQWKTKTFYDLAVRAIDLKVNSDGSSIEVIHPNEEGMQVNISDDSYMTFYNCVAVVKNNFLYPEFNDFSMVVRYTYKNVNALFTGDINTEYEYTMNGHVTKDGDYTDGENAIAPVGKIDVFKFFHHGTAGNVATDAFFDMITPDSGTHLAVVTGWITSAGKNAFDKCEKYGYDYRITGHGGIPYNGHEVSGLGEDIVVKTDGEGVRWG